jgi:hypothetical protein
LRVQMRAEIKKLQLRLGTTTIYVTHDQVEAMTMGSRIAVMRSGRIQQIGAPLEIYRKPANLFVAQFIGAPPIISLLRGRRAEAVVTDSFLPPQSVARCRRRRHGKSRGIRPEASPRGGASGHLSPPVGVGIEPWAAKSSSRAVGSDPIICKSAGACPWGERMPIAFDLTVSISSTQDRRKPGGVASAGWGGPNRGRQGSSETPRPSGFYEFATSAYQIEGSPLADGAGASIWHRSPPDAGVRRTRRQRRHACTTTLRRTPPFYGRPA